MKYGCFRAISLIVLVACATSAQQLTIYDDALATGWADWSWSSTRDFADSSPTYAGTASVSVQPQAFGALSLHHTAISASTYDFLEFYIHGSTNDSLDIAVYIQDDATTSYPELPLNNSDYIQGGSVSSGVWKRARIPFSDFGVTSPTFTRVNWKERTGTSQPTFYMDSIRFSSEFLIEGIEGQTNIQVSFSASTSMYYQAWTTESLLTGTWAITSMVLGANGSQVWTNAIDTVSTRFLRFARLTQTEPQDYDGDGLTDVYELRHIPLDPVSIHSDADSLPDGWEVQYSLSPTNTTGDDGDSGDPDNDGRSNLAELNGGTNPRFHERTEVPIYLDYPTGPWIKWVDGGAMQTPHTSYVYEHDAAARITLSSLDDLVGFTMPATKQDLTGFTNLEFYVNGGANSGQDFYVALRLGPSTWPGGISISTYTNIQADTWSKIQIPLAHLGAANATNLIGVFFKNTNNAPVSPFWVDNVKLVSLWPQDTPVVHINAASNVSATLSRRMFGVNVATWDSILTNAQTVSRLTEGGFRMLRYPGGSIADEYDWAKNTNKVTDSHYMVNTSNFLALANSIGAEKNITVNYGTGSAQEAADWVDHVYNTLNKTVEWWCVGNENFASWETDTNSPDHHAVEYASRWIAYHDAMKAVDSSIKVGIAGSYSEDDFTNSHAAITNPANASVHRGWSAVLLTHLAQSNRTPDFFEVHYYGPEYGNHLKVSPPERANDYHALTVGADERTVVENIRQMLTDYLGASAAISCAVHVTENNIDGYEEGKITLSLVNGLYTADLFGQACLAGTDAFLWWDLHNNSGTDNNLSSSLYGWREYADFGVLASGSATNFGDAVNERYPAFYAFKLLTNFAQPGDRLVEVTNNYPEILRTYACLEESSNAVSLLAINTSRESGLRPTIRIDDYTVTSNITVHSYGMSEDSNRWDITSMATTISPTNIRHTFPPYSMSVLRF